MSGSNFLKFYAVFYGKILPVLYPMVVLSEMSVISPVFNPEEKFSVLSLIETGESQRVQ